jgi:hypothetical protein
LLARAGRIMELSPLATVIPKPPAAATITHTTTDHYLSDTPLGAQPPMSVEERLEVKRLAEGDAI